MNASMNKFFQKCIFLFLMAAWIPAAHSDTTTGLIGYWRLEDTGTTAFDSSGNGGTGTINNAPASVTGKRGKALQFTAASSQDVVLAGGLSSMSGLTTMTMAAWMKRTAANNEVGVGEDDGGNNRVAITCFTDGNVYFNITNSPTNNYGTFTSNDTNWHHIILIYNGAGSGNSGRLQGYLDGLPVSLTYAGTIPASLPSAVAFYIGDTPSDVLFTNGTIDDVRVYNRALTASDVAELYIGGRSNNATLRNATLNQ